MRLRFSIFGNHYHFTFKMAGLTLFFVLLFSSLGLWQVHRAQIKYRLIQAYQERPQRKPLFFSQLFEPQKDSRFYSIFLNGHFDSSHTLFLDNKTLDGQLGYEVYTPFRSDKSNKAVLIDRGWVPANPDRRILPTLKPIPARLSLKGVVNQAPAYFSLGSMIEKPQPSFPLRVQYINTAELSPLLGLTLSPYIIWLDPQDPRGFKRHWAVTLMGPEKHWMYAVQWFAFAISLLVLFGALNLKRMDQ